jgi:hypothetical protein
MEVKIIKINRGKDILEYNTFYFAYKTKTTNIIRWRCTQRKCSAKLFTTGENMTIVRDESVHINHDEKNLNIYKINQLCKIKARESPYEKPANILRNVVQNSTISNDTTTKDIFDLRRNIYNTKRKILPKFPVSLNEVHTVLLTMDIKTHTGESFISSNNSDQNIIIFSCKTNIDFLCKSETIYLDGIFDYCPKLFTQLFYFTWIF